MAKCVPPILNQGEDIRLLTIRIKTISLSVIAKFKAENPDFDIDFESFVKELSTDDAVFISCGGDI